MASKGPALTKDPNTRFVAKGIFGLSGHGEIMTNKLIYQDNENIARLYQLSTDRLPDLRVLNFAGFDTCAFEYGTQAKFIEIAEICKNGKDISTWDLLKKVQSSFKATVVGEITSEELEHKTDLVDLENILERLMKQTREIVDALESNPDDVYLNQRLEENTRRLKDIDNIETNVGFEKQDASNALKGKILDITCPEYDKNITIRGTDIVYYSLQIFDIRYPDGYNGYMLVPGEVIRNGNIMEPYLTLFNNIIASKKGYPSHFLTAFLQEVASGKVFLSRFIELFLIFGVEVQNWVDTTCNVPDIAVSERTARVHKNITIPEPLEMYYGRKLTHAGTKKKTFKKKKTKKSKKKKTKRKRRLN